MNIYENCLEITDFPILGRINCPGECQWNYEVEKAVKDFESRFKTEVFILGRSGRHICVENNSANRRRLNTMIKWIDKWHHKMMDKYTWESWDE